MVSGACPGASPVRFAATLDRAAKTVGGQFHRRLFRAGPEGFFGPGDYALIESIPKALSETDFVCSSINVGSTKAGINMDAVAKMGKIVKKTAELTADRECIGAAKLVVFCNAPEDNPLYGRSFSRARRAGLRDQRGRFRARAWCGPRSRNLAAAAI